MHFKHFLATGIALALPALFLARLEANDGILRRIHHHHSHASDENTSVVRLPAQNIRIETTKPRVVVNEISAPHRGRGFFSPNAVVAAPIVGTFLAPGTLTFGAGNFAFGQPSGGSSSLDLTHALERQLLEISKAKASRLAEMNLEDQALQRLQGQVSKLTVGPAEVKTSDAAQLKKAVEDLSQRISAIEKLLIIHDNILKEKNEKEKR